MLEWVPVVAAFVVVFSIIAALGKDVDKLTQFQKWSFSFGLLTVAIANTWVSLGVANLVKKLRGTM